MAHSSHDGGVNGTDRFESILKAAETAVLQKMRKDLERVNFKQYLFALTSKKVITQHEEDDLYALRSKELNKGVVSLLIEKSEGPRKKRSPFDVLAEVLVKDRGLLVDMLYQEREAECARLRAQQEGRPLEDNSSDDDVDVRPGMTVYFQTEGRVQTRTDRDDGDDDDDEQPPPI